jgi:hypothetical protein
MGTLDANKHQYIALAEQFFDLQHTILVEWNYL